MFKEIIIDNDITVDNTLHEDGYSVIIMLLYILVDSNEVLYGKAMDGYYKIDSFRAELRITTACVYDPSVVGEILKTINIVGQGRRAILNALSEIKLNNKFRDQVKFSSDVLINDKNNKNPIKINYIGVGVYDGCKTIFDATPGNDVVRLSIVLGSLVYEKYIIGEHEHGSIEFNSHMVKCVYFNIDDYEDINNVITTFNDFRRFL